jgi:hypothetical protein
MSILVTKMRLMRKVGRRVVIPPMSARGVPLCRACHQSPVETRYAVNAGLCETCYAVAESQHHRKVVTGRPLRTAHTEV